ncbi:MAG: ABC transporter ATP-binding protein, partial [Cyclobacteriaceae bacterium]
PLNFANNIIIPVGTLFSELLLLALLILVVAIYDIQILFWLLAIVAPSLLLYRLNRNRIKKISDQIKETYPTLLKFTMESVEGWSEIKSFGKEGFFKAKFSNQFQKLGAIFSRDHTLHTNTSRVTELVALAGIAVLLVYTLINSKTPGDSIIALGIYFGIGFRAIPSVNRIFASWLRIKSNEYILSELIALGRSNQFAEVASTSSINFKEKIALSNISFTQPDGIEIFKGLSLTVLKGQRILIKGPSGSGKTTLLLLLMRFIKQQSGDLTVDDIAITSKLENAWLRKIAYVPQAPYILDATIKENIAFGVPKNEINNEKVSEFVSVLGLKNWVDEL